MQEDYQAHKVLLVSERQAAACLAGVHGESLWRQQEYWALEVVLEADRDYAARLSDGRTTTTTDHVHAKRAQADLERDDETRKYDIGDRVARKEGSIPFFNSQKPEPLFLQQPNPFRRPFPSFRGAQQNSNPAYMRGALYRRNRGDHIATMGPSIK